MQVWDARCDGLALPECGDPSSAVVRCDCGMVNVVNVIKGKTELQLRNPVSQKV